MMLMSTPEGLMRAHGNLMMAKNDGQKPVCTAVDDLSCCWYLDRSLVHQSRYLVRICLLGFVQQKGIQVIAKEDIKTKYECNKTQKSKWTE